MNKLNIRTSLVAAAAFSLAACGGGGGGGGGLASTPPPPPPPQGSTGVEIFQSPATQEFAALGSGDALRIRYDAGSGLYEVMAGAQGWKTLVDDPLSSPSPGEPNQSFLFGTATNQSYFNIRAHYRSTEPTVKYQYSNLAAWGTQDGGNSFIGHYVAFGIATPAAAIPVTGSATYNGRIEGTSSETHDGFDGANTPGIIEGSINLAFNFGSGTLSGSISPSVYLAERRAIGTLAFTDTVYAAGSTSFSGKFDTNIAGLNAFSGLFTGPNANELIGKFAFPYTSPFDGKAAQASGAFIGK